MIIGQGKNIPLNSNSGTAPDVSGALLDWFQPMTFENVVKSVQNFQAVETPTSYVFQGVIMPFTDRQLLLKPEGERAWTWYLLYAQPSLQLDVDDVCTYLGVQTRIMARKDYSLYGYLEYHCVQDWTGSGP